ncbi:hypothetical protein WME90_33135 [Sorangium sp. So ce375]|uniref:hypothetical protein n=1 Tax=Sorangium sp. So ce375 TaxID=3133306 RepID=UPI003F5AF165
MEENASRHVEEVPIHVAALILKILDGWAPSVPSFALPVQFLWNGRDLSNKASGILIEAGSLNVICSDIESIFFDHTERNDLRNKPFEGVLADGARFKADSAFLDVDRANGFYWSVIDARRPPRLWVTYVKGFNPPKGAGNLLIHRTKTSADGTVSTCMDADGYRFRGVYTYYFVKRDLFDDERERNKSDENAWFLIIDTGNESAPSRSHVYPDVLGLQFVFGRAFYFDLIFGIDESYGQVAIVGGRHGRDHSHRPRAKPPIPLDFCAEHWAPVFFAAISDTYHSRPELRLYIALTFYLDGLASYHVEGEYMTLHVALEAFAFWLLNQDPEAERPLVDKSKWREWLRENKDKIKALASPGFGETLYSKITSIPARRAASRVVEDAFQLMKIDITAEMASELDDGRGTIVHTALMFQESQENVESYTSRIAVVRTMLVALIARAVGYRGAILGWTKKPGRPYDEPATTWWPIDDEARADARQRFMIESIL